MARAVFVSHASVDAVAAATICKALEAAGIDCWVAPRDIAPGVEWADAIAAAIAQVRLLLLVHSEATDASVMVRREVTLALARGLALLPVRIDAALPRDGMQFYLSSTHWLDAFAGGVEANLGRVVAAAEAALSGVRPSAAPMAEAFAERPAIAVLPFRGYAEEDRLAEALTDDLIAAISAWRIFPVISRDSVFALARGDVDIRMLGRQLGARYFISGGVRRRGGEIRATVELVDAASAAVLLTETFVRGGDDAEALLGELTLAIAPVLAPDILRRERDLASRRPPANRTAYDLMQRGLWHRQRNSREDLAAAEALFHEALAVQPGYVRALTCLSISRNHAAIRRWTDDVAGAFREAMAYARRAVAEDAADPQAQFALGIAHMNLGQREQAAAALAEAIRRNPSHVTARANLGQVLNQLNRPEEGLAELQLALRLSPQSPFRYQWLPYLATSHYLAGRYRESLAMAHQALEAQPDYPLAVRYAAAALGKLGMAQQAAPLVAVMRRVDRDFANLEAMTRRLFVPAAAEHLLAGFAAAGFD